MSKESTPELFGERMRKRFLVDLTGDRAVVAGITRKDVEDALKGAFDEQSLGPDGKVRKRVTEEMREND